jgi:hypothetical protein
MEEEERKSRAIWDITNKVDHEGLGFAAWARMRGGESGGWMLAIQATTAASTDVLSL